VGHSLDFAVEDAILKHTTLINDRVMQLDADVAIYFFSLFQVDQPDEQGEVKRAKMNPN